MIDLEATQPYLAATSTLYEIDGSTPVPDEFNALFRDAPDDASVPIGGMLTDRRGLSELMQQPEYSEQDTQWPLSVNSVRSPDKLPAGQRALRGIRGAIQRTKEFRPTPWNTSVALALASAALGGALLAHSDKSTADSSVVVVNLQPSNGGDVILPQGSTPSPEITPSTIPSPVYIYRTLTATPEARQAASVPSGSTAGSLTPSPKASPSASASGAANPSPFPSSSTESTPSLTPSASPSGGSSSNATSIPTVG